MSENRQMLQSIENDEYTCLNDKYTLLLIDSKASFMETKMKISPKLNQYPKYLGLFLVIAGIPTMIVDDSYSAEIPLLVGLFILLVTTDKIEDERSIQIKTSSLYIAFIISYATKLIITNLHDHAFISFELTEINYFLILTLALANTIFYGRLYIIRF